LSIKIKENIIKQKNTDIEQSYNNFLPDINFTYGITANSKNDNSFSKYLSSIPSPNNPSFSKNLSINLPIFLGGKRFDLIKISKTNKEISEYDLNILLLELKSRAIALFIKAYNSQNQLKILNESLKLAHKNYENAKILKSVGKMVKVDLLTFKLSLEERKTAIKNIKTEQENTFIEMSSLINHDIKVSMLNINKKIPVNIIKMDKVTLGEYYFLIMQKNSPVIKKSEQYYKLSKYNVNLSRKNYYPDILLKYNYSPYTENSWEFPFEKGHSLSLLLNFNIFNSFRDSSDYKKKKIDLINTELQLHEIIKNQKYAIKKAVNILKNSLSQIKSVKLALKLSKEKLEQIKIGYKQGKYNYLDMMKAENDWLLKENNVLNLEMQIYNSYYQLEIISGNLKE